MKDNSLFSTSLVPVWGEGKGGPSWLDIRAEDTDVFEPGESHRFPSHPSLSLFYALERASQHAPIISLAVWRRGCEKWVRRAPEQSRHFNAPIRGCRNQKGEGFLQFCS